MASIAEDYGTKGKAAKAPISTHPAFPFIVALWFAALLGMGSLVVPVELVGQIAVSTGLASIVPATAPPLGFTARALIALAFTGAGALAGLLIARKIAQIHTPETGRSYPAKPQHRPIDAHAELGAHGLDGQRPAIQPKGRRSLAIELDHGPSEMLDFAPLPGKRVDANHSALEMLDLDSREFVQNSWVPDPADSDELELTEADLMPAAEFARSLPAAAAFSEPEPGFQTLEDYAGDATMKDMIGDRPPFGMPEGSGRANFAPSARQVFRAPSAPALTPSWSDDVQAEAPEPEQEPAAELAPAFAPAEEPLSFSPSSLARFDAPAEMTDDAQYPGENQDPVEDDEPMFENHAQFAPPMAQGSAAADDLDDLGLVQLAQRLGNSIERRRLNQAARAQQSEVVAASPLGEAIDVAAPDEAAQAMAAYFARPAEQPQVEQAPEVAETHSNETHSDETHLATEAEQTPVAERQMFRPVADEAPAHPSVAYGAMAGFAQIGFEDENEDEDAEINDLAASFSLPLGRQPAAQPAPVPEPYTPPPVATDAADAEPDYASLLALRNPFQDQRAEAFVRIEDEPESSDEIGQAAVVFPAEVAAPSFAAPAAFAPPPSAPVNSEENERALREALLSLQRMSGTA